MSLFDERVQVSAEFAIKQEIEELEARREAEATVLDEVHKELEKVRVRFDRQQSLVFRLSDRIEALHEAKQLLEACT